MMMVVLVVGRGMVPVIRLLDASIRSMLIAASIGKHVYSGRGWLW